MVANDLLSLGKFGGAFLGFIFVFMGVPHSAKVCLHLHQCDLHLTIQNSLEHFRAAQSSYRLALCWTCKLETWWNMEPKPTLMWIPLIHPYIWPIANFQSCRGIFGICLHWTHSISSVSMKHLDSQVLFWEPQKGKVVADWCDDGFNPFLPIVDASRSERIKLEAFECIAIKHLLIFFLQTSQCFQVLSDNKPPNHIKIYDMYIHIYIYTYKYMRKQ